MRIRVVVVVLVALGATGCSGISAAPPPATAKPVTRAEVTWADDLCRDILDLDVQQADQASVTDPSGLGPGDPDYTATDYLDTASALVDQLTAGFAAIPRLAEPAANQVVKAYAQELARIKPQVDSLSGVTVDASSASEQDQDALQVQHLVNSLRAPQPGFPAVVAADPTLTQAYALAPGCDPKIRQKVLPTQTTTPQAPQPSTPDAPLPTAANGTDLASCASGNCEVSISSTVNITVSGTTFAVTIGADSVTLSSQFPDGTSSSNSFGVGGSGSWTAANSDKTITAKLEGLRGGTAILKFTLS